MKFYTNKNIIQKILIVLLIIIVFNFTVPKQVNAGIGGVLMDPFLKFFTAIADVGQHFLEWCMTGNMYSYMQDPDSPLVKEGDPSDPNKVVMKESDMNNDLLTDFLFKGVGTTVIEFIFDAPYAIPIVNYSPEEIFSNKIPALDINFLSPKIQGDDERNSATQLRPVIASWYVALRTFAMVGLLSVLVYLGIRILISSTAPDKAKYKNIIKDWLVAMCILFLLHFIMSFILTISESITGMVSAQIGNRVTIEVVGAHPKVFSTNLVGYTRFMMQNDDGEQALGFFMLYIMLIVFTFRFTWTYLKRVFIMAFLTVISPLVALTYPIDKVGDGNAQAFNMWLKEYIYNALLQPMHLLLYLILVTSANTLAVKNPLYAIVALGFITQAEKLFKKMFGFDKASGGTVSPLATLAGGALAGKALQALGKGGGAGGKDKIRTKNPPQRQGVDVGGNKDGKGYLENVGNIEREYLDAAGHSLNGDGTRNANAGSGAGTPLEQQQQEWSGQRDPADTYAQDVDEAIDNSIPTGNGNNENWDDNDIYLNSNPGEESTPPRGDTSSTGTSTESESSLNSPPPVGINEMEGETTRPTRQHMKLDKWKDVAGRVAYSGFKTGIKGMAATAAGLAVGAGTLAATGDLSKAAGAAAGAGASVFGGIGKGFDAADRKLGTQGTIIESVNNARGKDAITKRNEKSDKAFRESEETREHMNHYYPNASEAKKKDVLDRYVNMRKSGETDINTMRKAVKMQDATKEVNGQTVKAHTNREVENVLQLDKKISDKVFSNKDVYNSSIEKVEAMYADAIQDKKLRRAVAIKSLNDLKEYRYM